YFVLDFEAGLLQYFVNEQSKHQKPRGVLSLSGAIVSLSDEAPHMLVVYSANGEMYKLRAADAKERQFWVTQLRACAKYHMETNSKVGQNGHNFILSDRPVAQCAFRCALSKLRTVSVPSPHSPQSYNPFSCHSCV
ncbi:hypothetical protein U0070_021645, partial [Myodes glareolus]